MFLIKIEYYIYTATHQPTHFGPEDEDKHVRPKCRQYRAQSYGATT
jgi:hypothetical protein